MWDCSGGAEMRFLGRFQWGDCSDIFSSTNSDDDEAYLESHEWYIGAERMYDQPVHHMTDIGDIDLFGEAYSNQLFMQIGV